jgi:hypothetical protein
MFISFSFSSTLSDFFSTDLFVPSIFTFFNSLNSIFSFLSYRFSYPHRFTFCTLALGGSRQCFDGNYVLDAGINSLASELGRAKNLA